MISVRVTGWDKAKKEVDDIETRTRNYSQALRVISQKMRTEVLGHFHEERGPDYSWEMSQRAAKENGQTLVDTGRMRSSIMANSGRDYAEVGTSNVKYASYHQTGTDRMPQREFLWFSKEFEEDMSRIFKAYVLAGRLSA